MKVLKHFFCAVALLAAVTGGLLAQVKDTLGLPITPPVGQGSDSSFLTTLCGTDTLTLSPKPTVKELVKIFVSVGRGRMDPFLALPAVIAREDSAVAALDTVLFSDPIAEITHHKVTGTGTSPGIGRETTLPDDTVRPSKLYAVMALEGIASQASYKTLLVAAQSLPNPDLRGIALRSLATAYHEPPRLEKYVPGKELIHLLVSNVDDVTLSPYLEKSLGQIAREGLLTWMGVDFGEPQGKAMRLKTAQGADAGTLGDYRELWWLTNASKLTWDSQGLSYHLK